MQVYLTCSTQIWSRDLVCISWQVPKGGCGLFEKYKQRANSRSVGGNVRVPACARLRLFTSRCSEEMVHHSHISIPSKYCVQRQHISARAHTQTHTHTIGHPQMTGVALAELMQRARPVLVVAAAEVFCQSFVMPVKCLRLAVFIRVCISRSSKTK